MAGDVWTFVFVAPHASKSEIFLSGLTAVLFGYDVVELKGCLHMVLVQTTVFAAEIGSLMDRIHDVFLHELLASFPSASR
jgi:hypothetical protein